MNKIKENRTIIATYGTLRSGFRNKRAITQHGPSAYSTLGITKVKDWSIISCGGFPGAYQDDGKEITVEVYEVSDNALASVRSLEGYNPNKPHNKQTFYDEVDVKTEFGMAKMYKYVNGKGGSDRIESGDWSSHCGIKGGAHE